MPIEYYSPTSGGAISTIIMSTARELLARGHRVTVLTIVNKDETYDVGEVIPVPHRERNDLSFIQRRISSLRQKMNRWDWPYFEYYLNGVRKKLAALPETPDAVIVFNDLVSPSYIKKVLPGTQVFVWLQNQWNTNFDIAKTDRATKSFLTCSDAIRRWTSQRHALPLDRFRVVPSGVEHEVFFPRADYLEPVAAPRVLFIGRIDPNKGPDLAADAVAALRAEGLAVGMTVAGGLWFYGHGREMEDPFFRTLKGKMDKAGAEYLGHVPRGRVPAMVREHDIVCVLSRSEEPFGLVALEAMASGCAVIASPRGGLPEACGGAALLADPDDLPAIIDAMRKLVTDPKFLARTKRQSVERAARAPWSACAQLVEEACLQSSRAVLTAAMPATTPVEA
jgi:glycosyltransferase involved in cell wall biosynthesis